MFFVLINYLFSFAVNLEEIHGDVSYINISCLLRDYFVFYSTFFKKNNINFLWGNSPSFENLLIKTYHFLNFVTLLNKLNILNC